MADTFKDIILPICQITSTLLVGGVIAFYLNRRTNKDKLKGLLIDSYMEYLKLYKNFHSSESDYFSKNIYKSILKTQSQSISPKTLEAVEKAIQLRSNKYDADWVDENANISFSTYKFAFLLGSKKYSEKLQNLEDKWVKHLSSFETRQKLIKDITNQIINNQDLIIFKKEDDISNYLIKIEKFIDQTLDVEMFNDFKLYNTAVANEIDAY